MPRTEGEAGGGVPLWERLSNMNDTRGHTLLLVEAKEGLGYRASIRIGAGKLSASAPSKKVLSSMGQIKQMCRIVCCYIRWSSPKLFDTKHVTNKQIDCDIISMKCKLACCLNDWNVQIHSTRVFPLCCLLCSTVSIMCFFHCHDSFYITLGSWTHDRLFIAWITQKEKTVKLGNLHRHIFFFFF